MACNGKGWWTDLVDDANRFPTQQTAKQRPTPCASRTRSSDLTGKSTTMGRLNSEIMIIAQYAEVEEGAS